MSVDNPTSPMEMALRKGDLTMPHLTDAERKHYIELLKECNKADIELAHTSADNILCRILIRLGYDDIVKEFQQIDKWYT